MSLHYQTLAQHNNLSLSVLLPPHESIDNGLNLLDYNFYNDYNNKFNLYLEYGKRYRSKIAFENTFYG